MKVVVAVMAALVSTVGAYSGGAPSSQCVSMAPGHTGTSGQDHAGAPYTVQVLQPHHLLILTSPLELSFSPLLLNSPSHLSS